MNNIFEGCYSLKNLNLANFINLEMVHLMGIFDECRSLSKLNYPNLKIEDTDILDLIFYDCPS